MNSDDRYHDPSAPTKQEKTFGDRIFREGDRVFVTAPTKDLTVLLKNLGIITRRVRNWLLVVTGLLTAVSTAFCGPISFIGLAVPHMARMLLGMSNHRSLLPFTILMGGFVALFCNLVCVLPGESGIIPLNAVTPIIGAPVIIYVLLAGRNSHRLN